MLWGVGITDIPDSRTRGLSVVGLGVGNKNTGPPDFRTRRPVAPTVLQGVFLLDTPLKVRV